MSERTAIIIGAGPAGLTAAYELLEKTDVRPIVFEASGEIGGISRTVDLHGNKIDIGGHRFYSPFERVIKWWLGIMPVQDAPAEGEDEGAPNTAARRTDDGRHSADDEDVFLNRTRLSRILFRGRFFGYPISLNWNTIRQLGFRSIFRMGVTYLHRRLFPIRPETSLEDFFENAFGRELYETFFKSYTEKVWGIPCNEIDSSWGPQQVQGISIRRAILSGLKGMFTRGGATDEDETEYNLTNRFFYPKYGPGQLWERVARLVQERGGEICKRQRVIGLEHEDGKIKGALVRDEESGATELVTGDYFFSTMPVADLISGLGDDVPDEVGEVAEGLVYRGLISVELLFKNIRIGGTPVVAADGKGLSDNWIYIQERDVRLARIQVLNNWSPFLVKDPNTAFVGLEYFADEGDDLWSRSDAEMIEFALNELRSIGIEFEELLDSLVVKEPRAYPVYSGTYERFDVIRSYADRFRNLFLLGRCGMHVYDSTDVYMLAAMEAVDNISNQTQTKDNIWKAGH